MRFIALFLGLLLVSNVTAAEPSMTQAKMEVIVKRMASESKGSGGHVAFSYNGINMHLVSDARHDRMRIVAPVAEYSQLSSDQIKAAMISNFHRALDARYAVSKGILYAAYIHPMSALQKWQVQSAVKQVANLANTFGSSYSSGMLDFGRPKPKTNSAKELPL